MRSEAIFIGVEVDDAAAGDAALATKLAEVCPVDIYAAAEGGGGVRIAEENLDECILCALCLRQSPEGTVKVLKLYEDGAALRA